jgi:hypothetical protein
LKFCRAAYVKKFVNFICPLVLVNLGLKQFHEVIGRVLKIDHEKSESVSLDAVDIKR